MKRTELPVAVFTAAALLETMTGTSFGQSCNCQPNQSFVNAQPAYVPTPLFSWMPGSMRLPPGWPTRWPGPAPVEDVTPVRPDRAPKHESPATTNPSTSPEKTSPAPATVANRKSVRDPFSGGMIPASIQMQLNGINTETTGVDADGIAKRSASSSSASRKTGLEAEKDPESPSTPESSVQARRTDSSETNPATGSTSQIRTQADSTSKPWSILPSKDGSGMGGGLGGSSSGGLRSLAGGSAMSSGATSGGGMMGSSGGSNTVADSGWSPQAGSSGAAMADNGGSGSSGRNSPTSTTSEDSGTTTNPPAGSGDSDSGGIDTTDGDSSGGDSSVVVLPDPEIPDAETELPDTTQPDSSGHIINGGSGGNTPVVPEPGTALLLGIAGGVAGAGFIRRRLRQNRSEKQVQDPALPGSSSSTANESLALA